MLPLPESWFDKLTMSGRTDFTQALTQQSSGYHQARRRDGPSAQPSAAAVSATTPA